jgi:tetratricopeptide (TPR) repeat protein
VKNPVLKGVCCAFVFTVAAGPVAQPAMAQVATTRTAEEEAVRRQQAAKLMAAKVKQAAAEEKKGRVEQAATLYQEAVGLIPQVGLGTQAVENDKALAVAGLVKHALILAKAAQDRQDFAAADIQLSRALNADATNPTVIAAKETNDKLLQHQRGRVPSEATVARAGEFREERIEVGTMVQDGKWL